jgi:4-alpha-glucanotransferase
VDFLADSGQKVWQVLPLGPTSYGDSPYQSLSTFAGNPNLISLDALLEEGLCEAQDLKELPEGKVDYCQLHEWKLPLLHKIAEKIKPGPDFETFCQQHKWLPDYALFLALKAEHNNQAWNQWPKPFRHRQPEALAEARQRHARVIQREMIIQWLFFKQWNELRAYAKKRNVQIFGDIPIFVAMDSADTWCNPHLFQFNADLQPTAVAGVPPDYFAPTGQLWGNPLYDWKAHKAEGYAWWIDRVQAAFGLYDILRVDHFRGFAGYWRVSAKAKTAESGRWVKGPGPDFFKTLLKTVSNPIIAEDLGDITPDVTALRDQFKLPGMKILQFGFGSGSNNPFLPHNFESPHFVAYTGTHDNDTVRGWYENGTSEEQRYARDYFGNLDEPISRTLIRATLQSVARVAIIPLQDLLDLGSEARMNFPGRAHDNWQWRLLPNQLTEQHRDQLKTWTRLYGR